MMETFSRVWSGDEGQDLVEYALLLFLLAIATMTILSTLGTHISGVFSDAASELNPVGGGGG
jgi:pilus assembly protein Flp/PilA